MLKMVNLLVAADGLSREAFAERFLEAHVPIAEEMPGIRRYVTSLPKDPEKSAYDGMAELYFEDSAALGAAFGSDAGERTQADAAEFLDVDASETLVVEETVQVQ